MLAEKDVVATIPVKDLAAAKTFYEGKLGLKREPGDQSEALRYRSGKTEVLVYKSPFAGSNKATAATWTVGKGKAVDDVVRELSGKGVRFERYDMPNIKHEGDVHVSDSMRVAWCKDPEGNILAIVGEG